MNNVHDISDHKPHIVLQTMKATRVLPVSLIKDVINGKKDITDIEDYEDILSAILTEWLCSIEFVD